MNKIAYTNATLSSEYVSTIKSHTYNLFYIGINKQCVAIQTNKRLTNSSSSYVLTLYGIVRLWRTNHIMEYCAFFATIRRKRCAVYAYLNHHIGCEVLRVILNFVRKQINRLTYVKAFDEGLKLEATNQIKGIKEKGKTLQYNLQILALIDFLVSSLSINLNKSTASAD